MRPVDQLMDAFKRVCKIPQHRIKIFSCGHVIGPKQLLAISIGIKKNFFNLIKFKNI